MTSSIPQAQPAAPICFRGTAYRAAKQFWNGTQRIISPEQTLERIRPHFRKIGLTRLANITGLDRIGIHTVLSVRPNSAYLSVDAGKGFSLPAANASAAMECFERHAAESVRLPQVVASYERMLGDGHLVPALHLLPLSKHSLFRPDRPERWTFAWDLNAQREVALPVHTVTLERYRIPWSDPVSFQLGSNGLSAGNDFLEALSGGLLELIERDAVACQRLASERLGRIHPRVALDTIEHPEVLGLVARLDSAAVELVLFDCTVDTAVPVFMAYIYDRERGRLGIYRGYGAHLDPGIAMIRAITEAVQSRLIYIAGSRDDIFRHHHRLQHDTDERAIRGLEAIEPTADARRRPSEATASFEGDVAVLLEKLRRVGLTQVLVCDLTEPELGVHVVRVMVPGLEGYMFETYTPGPRAKAFLGERA